MSKDPFRDSAGNRSDSRRGKLPTRNNMGGGQAVATSGEEPRRPLYTVFSRVYEVVRKPFVSPKLTAREVEEKKYVGRLADEIAGIVEEKDPAMAKYVRKMAVPPTTTTRSEDWIG